MNTAAVQIAAINPDRLAEVMSIELHSGGHRPGDQMCVMEAVAYVAGEKWSDAPQCACPVISTFLRSWNDALPDAERTELLRDLIPRLVGTRGTPETENRRATMAADWLVRTHTAAWLRLAGLTMQADALTSLPEITNFAQYPGLMPTLNAVRSDAVAAWDAAWDAARDAARDAAWDAARAAARAAAGDAARAAARAAAGAAAGVVARVVARVAAGVAAGDALAKTKRELQASAKQLVIRMCEIKDAE